MWTVKPPREGQEDGLYKLRESETQCHFLNGCFPSLLLINVPPRLRVFTGIAVVYVLDRGGGSGTS